MSKILVNSMRTPDGTVITSRYCHDFVEHKDANGEIYFVDGGYDYLRRSVNDVPAEDLSAYSTDPHEIKRERVEWGTYGKDGKGPLTYKKICDLSMDHITAILDTQKHISEEMRVLFQDEINWRINRIGEIYED